MSTSASSTEQPYSTQSVAELLSSTDRFYEEHAAEYFQRTVSANIEHLYDRFLPRLPEGARILDAGCGSGRDLRVFLERGFRPIGVDASPMLVEMARSYSGAPCFVRRFEELTYDQCFEGIWACASVLHVPKAVLNTVLHRFHRALVPHGVLYASVQEGSDERVAPDGRFFANYQPAELLQATRDAGFDAQELWRTEDVLPGRSVVGWINVLARASTA
jgi:SAM-dependent methyltransferase